MELVGGAKRQCLLCIVRVECTVCITDRCINREKEKERKNPVVLVARWLISFVPTMNDTIYLNGIEISCTRALFLYDILITWNYSVECSHDTRRDVFRAIEIRRDRLILSSVEISCLLDITSYILSEMVHNNNKTFLFGYIIVFSILLVPSMKSLQ